MGPRVWISKSFDDEVKGVYEHEALGLSRQEGLQFDRPAAHICCCRSIEPRSGTLVIREALNIKVSQVLRRLYCVIDDQKLFMTKTTRGDLRKTVELHTQRGRFRQPVLVYR